MAKDYIKKRYPVSLYKIREIEYWLSDMADKGFVFEDADKNKVRFKNTESANISYYLEPLRKSEEKPEKEKILYYSSYGWEYKDTVDGIYHVYCSVLEKPWEMHTDEVVYSYLYERLYEKSKRTMLILLFGTLFWIIFVLYIFRGGIIFLFLESNYGIVIICSVFKEIYDIIAASKDFLYLKKTIKYLQCKAILKENKDDFMVGNARSVFNYTYSFLVVLIMVLQLYFLYQSSSVKTYQINHMKPIPTIMLEELEKEHSDVYDYGKEDYIEIRKSVLSPVQYEIRQYGNPIYIQQEYEERKDTRLITEYYKLANKGLVKPVAWMTIGQLKTLFSDNGKIEIIKRNQSEIIYYWKKDYNHQELTIAMNDTVTHFNYKGTADLKAHLDEIIKNIMLFHTREK